MVNLPIKYSDKQVTPFGGMSLMKRFLDQTENKGLFAGVGLGPAWFKSRLFTRSYCRIFLG